MRSGATRRSRARAALLAAGVLSTLLASAALAVGDLTQKPGTAGCVSETGTGGACVDVKALTDPHGLAISPDGTSAYAVSLSGGSVAIFDRNPATGALTQKAGTAGCISETGTAGECADGKALKGAIAVTISPDGANVYVSSILDDVGGVAIFDRNTTTGALTQKAGIAGCISDDGTSGACTDGTELLKPRSIAISPDGNSAYVAAGLSGAVAIFDRNPNTGALTQKAGTAGCISDTGSLGACVDGKALATPRTVTVAPGGSNVYVTSDSGNALTIFDRNPTTGALTQKAGTAGCISETGAGPCVDGKALLAPTWLEVSPDGATVYVSTQTSDAVAIFDRSPATGALTQKAGTAGCISETGTAGVCTDGKQLDGADAVTISPDGASAYVTSLTGGNGGVAIFNRSIATGDLTQKAGTGGCVSDNGTTGTCADGEALQTSHQVVVSPDGAFVYIAAQASAAVAIFDRSTPPQTTIDSGPSGSTNDTTPTFTFSSNEPGSTFECRLDGQPFTVCAGPGHAHTSVNLTDGAHTFEVRATDLSADTDLTPASRTFTVDTSGPETAIASGPNGQTDDDTPTFGLTSTDPGSSFECRVDTGPFDPCSGPAGTHTPSPLADGPHTFEARAVDPGGNTDPTPAARAFSVDSTPPVTRVTKAPKSTLTTKGKKAKVKVSFSSEAGAAFQCRLDEGSFTACSSPVVVKVKSKGGKGAKHAIEIRAIDGLGNVESELASVAFRVIRKG